LNRYIEWNSHEPEEGFYNFEGDYDLIQFLKTANDLGLLVILRTGPFIDAEREFVSVLKFYKMYFIKMFYTTNCSNREDFRTGYCLRIQT
jgi:beta-galactosidase GanA